MCDFFFFFLIHVRFQLRILETTCLNSAFYLSVSFALCAPVCTRFANSEILSRIASEGTFIVGTDKSRRALHFPRNLLGCREVTVTQDGSTGKRKRACGAGSPWSPPSGRAEIRLWNRVLPHLPWPCQYFSRLVPARCLY